MNWWINSETHCIECRLWIDRASIWLPLNPFCVHSWDTEQCKRLIEATRESLRLSLINKALKNK